jgi:2-phosphosulfolactate phosphatase
MFYDQAEYNVRFEWGRQGVAHLAPISDIVIIVDVLSFSTTVDIAVGRGAIVYPYRGPGEEAAAYAASLGAGLARWGPQASGYSLSPSSMLFIEAGARLVLPSPNGSTLSLATGPTPVFAGCLRNAQAVSTAAVSTAAVSTAAMPHGRQITVIAAGERWKDDGSLRPAIEDLLGAGAIIGHLSGSKSPEAAAAAAVFAAFQSELPGLLEKCSSGKELIERGFASDVRLASQLNASDSAPILIDSAYRRWEG